MSHSVPSMLLSREENECVFSLVGPKGQCKATAVAQMYHAYPNADQWSKFRTGVVCLVKDHLRRSYFIRLLDITVGALLFEQELYKEFVYRRDHSFFHSFAGDSFMVGLNFADEGEAFSFYQAVSPKLKPRAIAPDNEDIYMRVPVQQHRSRSQTIMVGTRPRFSASTRRKSRRVKPRTHTEHASPRKEHLVMLGFDPNTGHFDAHRIDPLWLKLLHSVGVTVEQLKDVRTATFIVEFVEKHGGIEEANRQLLEATRSPPASPVRSRTRSVMIRRGKSVRGRGHRPPGQHMGPPTAGLVPAPPPLPPLQQGVPHSVGAPTPTPVPTITSPADNPPQPRPTATVGGDLLADIQAGLQLRPVDTSNRGVGEKPLTGMAAALANALSMRNKAMQFSDEDNGPEEVDEEWDDWGSD